MTTEDLEMILNFTIYQLVSILKNNLPKIDQCSLDINKRIEDYNKTVLLVLFKNFHSKNNSLEVRIHQDLRITMIMLEVVIIDVENTKIKNCNVTGKLSEDGKNFQNFLVSEQNSFHFHFILLIAVNKYISNVKTTIF